MFSSSPSRPLSISKIGRSMSLNVQQLSAIVEHASSIGFSTQVMPGQPVICAVMPGCARATRLFKRLIAPRTSKWHAQCCKPWVVVLMDRSRQRFSELAKEQLCIVTTSTQRQKHGTLFFYPAGRYLKRNWVAPNLSTGSLKITDHSKLLMITVFDAS